jgi:hypothetical protein
MCGNCSDPSQPWPSSEPSTPPSTPPTLPSDPDIPTLVEEPRLADLIDRNWNQRGSW